MSTMVGFRALNRSVRVRIGGKSLNTNNTVLLNIDSRRVKRDLGRHASIASFLQTVSPFFQNDDGVINGFGGKVTTRATGLVLDVAAIAKFTRADGTTTGSSAVGTATIGAADGTNPRIDTIAVNTTDGSFVTIAGTATAGASGFNLSGKGTVPANRIVLAYVVVPANATNLTQSSVIDARP